MNGAERLVNIAFYVSIAVIVLLAIFLSIVFSMYTRYKVLHIHYGHEDEVLKKQIRKKYRKILNSNDENRKRLTEIESSRKGYVPLYELVQDLPTVKTYLKKGEKEVISVDKPRSIYAELLNKEKQKRRFNRVYNAIYSIFYVIFGIFIIFSVIFRINDQEIYFGDTTYMIIKTGSMEEINPRNEYLANHPEYNSEENRISQYSLIGITKVEAKDIHEGDIVAFYYEEEDVIIVHRVVYRSDPTLTGSDTVYYTLQGDANSGSAVYETAITYDDIIGKYNGYQSYGLGIVTYYLQSNIGLIALSSALLFLLSYNISESQIDKAYLSRHFIIARNIDEEYGIKSL